MGAITIASDGDHLIGLWNDGQKYHGNEIFKGMTERDDLPVFVRTKKWLDRYFAGERPLISELPLAPAGSAFRQTVWAILCKIPYGETVTYGDIAKRIAAKMNKEKMSAQAVGGAVGHNPISIVIPCHRVVGSDGNLTGYAGGIDVKIKLLEHEGADISKLSVPKKGTAI
jgi:methylated-DNA-[protein]-cysteine S-methyltransferase